MESVRHPERHPLSNKHSRVDLKSRPWRRCLVGAAYSSKVRQTTQVTDLNPPPIQVSAPSITQLEVNAASQALVGGYLGMGIHVQEFEQQLEQFFKRPVATASTGTTSLQLALQAIDIGPGDEVLVPSLTYVASFQAITATGATPVACEVKENSLTLDLEDAARRLTHKTRAVMPVHYGIPLPRPDEIYAFADEHGLRTVEDAAHSFGSFHEGALVGSFGDVAVFSFDPIKNITTIDGGCVVSADPDVIARVKDLRVLAVMGDSAARANHTRLYDYDVREQGWRYHLNNVSAVIGLTQLKRLASMRAKRQELASTYLDLLQELPVACLDIDIHSHMPHIFVIKVQDVKIRDELRKFLKDRYNIATAIHWKPNHQLSYFQSQPLPRTEALYERILTLPLHVNMEVEDVHRIGSAIAAYFQTLR